VGPRAERRGRKGSEYRGFFRGADLQVKTVQSFCGVPCGLAEEHSIVYNFRLTEMFVAELCFLTVVMSEVSRLPRGVVPWATGFWVSS
jgi:hypothetical protein